MSMLKCLFFCIKLQVLPNNYMYLENSPKKIRALIKNRAKRIDILIIKVNKWFSSFSSRCFLKEIENMYSVFLLSFIINLLVFYHKCHYLIGYATHVLLNN